jgi:hypothetical protein
VNSAEFSREIGLNSAEFFRSKKGSSNSAENMNSYEFTIIAFVLCTAPVLNRPVLMVLYYPPKKYPFWVTSEKW